MAASPTVTRRAVVGSRMLPALPLALVVAASAGVIVISILGLPTSAAAASASEGWVQAPSFDFLTDTLSPSLALGTVLALIAALRGRAARLQRDTEGLA